MTEIQKPDQTSPYFKMYPRDFFASSNVARMTSVERGTYIQLLMREWMDGFISSDVDDLSAMLGMQLEEFEKQWKRISRCFEPVDGKPDKLVNTRLESEREDMIDRSELNRAAAEKRWGKTGNKQSQCTSDASAMHSHTDGNASAMHSVSHPDPDPDPIESSKLLSSEAESEEEGSSEQDDETPNLGLEIQPNRKKRRKGAPSPLELGAYVILDRLVPLVEPYLGSRKTVQQWRRENKLATLALVEAGVTADMAADAFESLRARDGLPFLMVRYLREAMVGEEAKKILARSGSAKFGKVERGWVSGEPVECDGRRPNGFSLTTPKGVTQDEARAWLRNGVKPAKFSFVGASA